MTPLQRQVAQLLQPLLDFYISSGVPTPEVTAVDGGDLPEPYRTLLVHENDMTSTLEGYFRAPLRLRILEKISDASTMTRQVVLQTDDDRDLAAEFGAIRISLLPFGEAARADILECRRPLGAILNESGIQYRSRPNAFFTFTSDAIANDAFGVIGPHVLYGRHNLLVSTADQAIAEVVEILPPLPMEARP